MGYAAAPGSSILADIPLPPKMNQVAKWQGHSPLGPIGTPLTLEVRVSRSSYLKPPPRAQAGDSGSRVRGGFLWRVEVSSCGPLRYYVWDLGVQRPH